jgi:hypothetical protein
MASYTRMNASAFASIVDRVFERGFFSVWASELEDGNSQRADQLVGHKT